MSILLSSKGSIQWIAIGVSALLLVAGGSYYGYDYYTSLTKEVVVEQSTSTETKKEVVVDTTSKEVLVSGISGDVFFVGSSGDTLLKNEKMVSLDGSSFYTTSDARMALIFSDRSIVRLDSNTRVSLRKWAQGNIVVILEKGRVWARVIGQAGWNWKLEIALGKSKAIVQGTSLEALKMPLYSKFTVLDSSSQSGSESSGIDVIDGSGVLTRVLPENKWIASEFGESVVKPINIKDVYESNAFALMNTQEDIVYLQDAIENFSGSIDIEKAQKEILASIPELGTEESTVFFSGTTLSTASLSGDISSQEWSGVAKKILSERADEYNALMKQNQVYVTQVLADQEKLIESINKANGQILDQTKEMIEGVVREQEVLLSNIMMQNDDFLKKINQDVGVLMQEQQKMLDGIMSNTMNMVDSTIKNATQWMGTSSESIQIDGTVTTSSSDDLDSFEEQDSSVEDMENSSDEGSFREEDTTTIQGNSMNNGTMNMNWNSMSNGQNSMSNDSDDMSMEN